jgi:hypothetical protein
MEKKDVGDAFKYLEDDMETVIEWADSMGWGAHSFTVVFRRKFGYNPGIEFRRRRMRKIEQAIFEDPARTAKEVANVVGMSLGGMYEFIRRQDTSFRRVREKVLAEIMQLLHKQRGTK